ncbi:ribosomal protein S21 [Bradyrhizobium elkanii]
MHVLVRDNNIDQALRVLKKKMQREGVFREMKQRRAYEKPSERKSARKIGGHSSGPQARSEAGDPRRIAAGASEEKASRAQAAFAAGHRHLARISAGLTPLR